MRNILVSSSSLPAAFSSIMYEVAKEIRKIVTLGKTINPCDHKAKAVTGIFEDLIFSN